MSLTNFLPPAFITSNALYQYSEFLEQKNNLVFGHYFFFWRYAAGVITTLFYVFFIKVIKRVFKEKPFSSFFPLVLFMIMVTANSPTHTMVQIRIFKTIPVDSYQAQQGVLGFSLCIAYLFYLFKLKTNNKKIVVIISIFAVLILLYSSIRRPNYLWHMMEMIGLENQGLYPNPFYEVLKIIRGLFPRFLTH